MKTTNLKMIAVVAVITTQLIAGTAYASHQLTTPKDTHAAKADGHISWHEFRQDVSSYPMVNASIDHFGVISLTGEVESAVDKAALERLASKVRGATDIQGTLSTSD